MIREAFPEEVTFNSGISADTGGWECHSGRTKFTGEECMAGMQGLGMGWVRNSSAYGLNDKFIYIFIYSANFQWVLKELGAGYRGRGDTHCLFVAHVIGREWWNTGLGL